MSDKQVKGLHAIIEHHGVISEFDCHQLETLLKRSATAAGATILRSNFHDFGDAQGKTGVLMLAESHMSVHTWPENKYAAIDLFFCGEDSHDGLEPVKAAIEVLRRADRHGRFSSTIISRGLPQTFCDSPMELR